MRRVLHLLSQRPSLTGSGITLDAFVRHAARAGWEQRVSCGVPHDDPEPEVGGLVSDRIHPLAFGEGALDFPVPGMSDVMPYESTVFSRMSEDQVARYREAWRRHILALLERFQPDVIHSHHVWIMSSMVKATAPEVPLVIQCHATGLRQMQLCPHLAGEVRDGCRRADGFVVLHEAHAEQLRQDLGVDAARVHVVGAGYREELFHAQGREEGAASNGNLLYIGKYSHSKGLPWLLDAVERLADRMPGLMLHVAGAGAGAEAEALRERMAGMPALVTMHGQIAQAELAGLMRRCAVCVLPSMYEGVPLVLAEALACGCRLVATRLPGVLDPLARHFGDVMELVDLPRIEGADIPVAEDLPAFVDRLTGALETAFTKAPLGDPMKTFPNALLPFQWSGVFSRVENVWTTV